jgi:hypothetical protein
LPERLEGKLDACLEKAEVWLRELKATNLEANKEEVEVVAGHRKSIIKRPKYKLSGHWRIDTGIGF